MVEGLVAYQQGDEKTLRELMDPDIEIYSEPGMVNAGTFKGFDGWRQWASQWEEAWESITYEALEIIEVDDSTLVAPVRVVGKGVGSGLEIDRVFHYLYEIRNGKGVRFHVYLSEEHALEAAAKLAADRA
jgi:ketosteroid isomerase-like protein